MKCQNNTIEVEHSGDRWVFMFSDEPCIWQKNPQHCDHSTIYLDVGNGQNVTLCSRDYCILKEALSGCPFRVMFPTTETACRPHFTHQCMYSCKAAYIIMSAAFMTTLKALIKLYVHTFLQVLQNVVTSQYRHIPQLFLQVSCPQLRLPNKNTPQEYP